MGEKGGEEGGEVGGGWVEEGVEGVNYYERSYVLLSWLVGGTGLGGRGGSVRSPVLPTAARTSATMDPTSFPWARMIACPLLVSTGG